MVDGLTPQDPLQIGNEPIPVEVSPRGGFLASPTGRIAVIAGAVVALLVVVGVVGFVLLPGLFGEDDVAQTAKAPTTPVSQTATGAVTGANDLPHEADVVPYNDVFTFRDIFHSLLPDAVAEETTDATGTPPGATPGTTTTETPDVSDNTLYLQDVVVVDGVAYAYLIWNGQEYVLAEGESIPNTPWQVLSVAENSVVMLYGDVQVTLTVGQGVTK